MHIPCWDKLGACLNLEKSPNSWKFQRECQKVEVISAYYSSLRHPNNVHCDVAIPFFCVNRCTLQSDKGVFLPEHRRISSSHVARVLHKSMSLVYAVWNMNIIQYYNIIIHIFMLICILYIRIRILVQSDGVPECWFHISTTSTTFYPSKARHLGSSFFNKCEESFHSCSHTA